MATKIRPNAHHSSGPQQQLGKLRTEKGKSYIRLQLSKPDPEWVPTPMMSDLMSKERTQLFVIQSVEAMFSDNDPTRITPTPGCFAIQPDDLARFHRG